MRQPIEIVRAADHFWGSVGLVTSIKFRSVTSALSSAETSVGTNVEFSLVTIALFIFLRSKQCRN